MIIKMFLFTSIKSIVCLCLRLFVVCLSFCVYINEINSLSPIFQFTHAKNLYAI